MANQSLGARVQERLAQAVGSNLLPEDVQAKAEKLLGRLEKPVRVALMGLPNSGKSTILNLLAGQTIIPDGIKMPTLQLTYGPEPVANCTLPDGGQQEVEGAYANRIAELEPVFVDMQLPLAALRKISILEVVTPEDATAMHRATQWAAGRAEVGLWCTQGFSSMERLIWSQVPDILKDHSFLMVTKADFLNSNNMMDKTLSSLRDEVADEFHQIMPICATDALASRKSDGTVDKKLMRSSGGTALISGVLKQVEYGKQTAVDMADVLLHQHADALADMDKVAAAPVAPAPTKASAEPVAEEPKAPAAADEPVADNVVSLQPATRAAYEGAIDYIVKNSFDLIELADDMDDGAPAKIIAMAVDHVQWVSDHLNDNGDDADPSLGDMRITAMDAADLIQLMQMEKRDSATIEALSLLLQLKRELQADLAA